MIVATEIIFNQFKKIYYGSFFVIVLSSKIGSLQLHSVKKEYLAKIFQSILNFNFVGTCEKIKCVTVCAIGLTSSINFSALAKVSNCIFNI